GAGGRRGAVLPGPAAEAGLHPTAAAGTVGGADRWRGAMLAAPRPPGACHRAAGRCAAVGNDPVVCAEPAGAAQPGDAGHGGPAWVTGAGATGGVVLDATVGRLAAPRAGRGDSPLATGAHARRGGGVALPDELRALLRRRGQPRHALRDR